MMASASAGKVELVAVMVPSRATGDAEVTIERDNVLVLRPGREEPSLVLVHPASGSASGFRRLAACYRVDRALYAFEALEPGPSSLCSIAALAADYLDQLRSAGIAGDLVLGGWSLGGTVAVEMARQGLSRQGRVHGVLLFDSATPAVSAGRRPLLALSALVGAAVGDDRRWDLSVVPLDRVVEEAAAALRSGGGRLATVEPEDLRPFAEAFAWHLALAGEGWSTAAPGVPAVLLRAVAETGWEGVPEDLGWRELFGDRLRVEWCGGTHESLFAHPHLDSLVELIEGAVRQWAAPGD
jgi:thioesterase domain-containing protein